MEALSLPNPDMEEENADLKALLEAFGSMISLEVIASAYLEANRNAGNAAEILYEKRSFSRDATCSETVEEGSPRSKHWRQKRCPASIGTVSNVIGKDYARHKLPMKGRQDSGPLKLDWNEIPESVLWDEENRPAMGNVLPEDTEKFLIDMLGDGFKLRGDVIQEVLGHCGYNVEQSMEKLLDLSASTLEKSDDIVGGDAVKFEENSLPTEKHQPQEPLQNGNSIKRSKYDLQREVLESLFGAPQRPKELPKTRPLRKIRSKAFGTPVLPPPKETIIEPAVVTVQLDQAHDSESEEDDNSFRGLRKAVKEYWGLMKEYYKASIEAYAAGEQARAYKLMEEGHFYSKKAREADEKSAQKVLETKENEMNETVVLDLKEQDKREAISLLKFHLTSLSGIPSIEFLKVRLGSTEDPKGGARKRLIMKLLERESIKWEEKGEEDGQVFVIQVSKINPKGLNFSKKY